jgi:predicted O-methyltransferase YrrM
VSVVEHRIEFVIYQDRAEFNRFTELAQKRDVRRYMEIGCREGGTFGMIMMKTRAKYGLAIDLPESEETKAELQKVANYVHSATGAGVEIIFGDSQNPDVAKMADVRAPFDLVMIDADHRYAGVERDWLNYRHMAPVIAFHDIAAPPDHISDGHINDCAVFWDDLKRGKYGHYLTEEIITPESCMGFGIVYT